MEYFTQYYDRVNCDGWKKYVSGLFNWNDRESKPQKQ